MIEASRPEGWWLASDGRWYPPEQRPAPPGQAPAEPRPPTGGGPSSGNRWLVVAIAAMVVVAIIGAWALLPSGDDAGIFAVEATSHPATSDLVALLGFDPEAGHLTGYDPGSGTELWEIDGRPVLGWADDGRFLLAPGNRLEQRASSDGSLLWTADLGNGVDPAAVVGDQIIFLSDETLTALDFRSGQPLWSWSGVERRVFAFGNGHVLVQDEDRDIVALDASSGRERWRSDADVDLGYDVTRRMRSLRATAFGLPSYALDDDVLVLYEDHFDDSRDAVALDASNGREIWRIPGIDHHWVAILDDAAVLIAGEGVLAVDLNSGEERWSREVGVNTAVIHGDTLVLASSEGGAIGLEAATGEVRWESPLDLFVLGIAGQVVVARSAETFVGLDGSTGQVEWTVDHDGEQWIPIPDPGGVTNGLVVIVQTELDESGAITASTLVGVDVVDGRVQWTQAVG